MCVCVCMCVCVYGCVCVCIFIYIFNFNLYAEYIMRNAELHEAQTRIKIAGRNINNLRYTDVTTLMVESEELKSLLRKMKEESGKAGLKPQIQKTKIMASVSITSRQIDGETMETVTDFISWSPKSLQVMTASMKLRLMFLGRKSMTNLDSILKSRDITCKGLSSQRYGFSSSHIWMQELEHKEG